MIKYEKKILKGLLSMRTVFTIEQLHFEKNGWICSIKEEIDINQLQPAGQVLTDSDHLAFIYIVIENGEYSYIRFSKNVWPALLKIVQNKDKIFLQCGNEKLELVNFVDELEMLLFNIEGNGNYGEVFVNAVETIFEPIFKGDTI